MYQGKNGVKVYSPNHTRSFCYIDDAVKMMIKTIKSSNKNETFNIGNHSDEIKIFDLAKKIKKKISNKFDLMNGEVHLGSPIRRVPSMKKYFRIYGKLEYTSLEIGLKKTLNWYRKFYKLNENINTTNR